MHVCVYVAEQEESDAEEDQHDADLQWIEDPRHSVGHALILLDSDWNRSGLKEALAGLGLHVGSKLLRGAKALNQLSMHVALQLEDARPATIFEKLPNDPRQCSQETGKRRESRDGLDGIPDMVWLIWRCRHFRPHRALKRLRTASAGKIQIRKQVVLRIARDVRMLNEELRQLRIVFADVLLIRKQRRIVCHNRGERGTGAQQLQQLLLRGLQFLVAHGRYCGWRCLGRRGLCVPRTCRLGDEQEDWSRHKDKGPLSEFDHG